MKSPLLQRWAVALVAAAGFGACTIASAFPIVLTQAGIDKGFSISTVVSGMAGGSGTPSCCYVLGSAVNSDGKILLNNAGDGNNYLFNNADNQGKADAISHASNPGFPTALATANGKTYASGSNLRLLNNDGSTQTTFNGIYMSAGMWTNQANQHLVGVGSANGVGSGLLDIDVSGGTPVARLINGASSDGVTVSPDGSIVYTNSGAYRFSDGVQIGSFFVSGADGMGVIASSNDLNGDVVVSTVDGNLILLDVDNNYAQTVIATGGGYGDFASPDTTTGTLLFSSGDSLMRLSCGAGCGVGSVNPNPSVPEPASLALVGIALVGMGYRRVRKNA